MENQELNYKETEKLDKNFAVGITITGLLIALMTGLQYFVWHVNGIGFLPGSIIIAMLSNLLILPALVALASKRSEFVMAALIWVHLSMGTMIICFTQVYSPFITSWAILVLISFMYYSWKGFGWSIIALAATALAYNLFRQDDILAHNYGIAEYAVLSILILAITTFISYLFVRIISETFRKNRELTIARKSELVQINRQTTLLNSISDAVLTLNKYGRITSQNAGAQVFFDTNASLIGRDIDVILQLRDYGNKPRPLREIIAETKSSSSRDDLSIGSGGEVRHLSIQISRIRGTFDDEEEYGVVLIIRDITKQKTLEEEKDEFISVTSHELRTPVAIAEGSLSNLLLMQERKADEAKLRQAANDAHNQVIYLAKMINDLSTLSRAERGVGDAVETININRLLHDLFAKYTPEAEQKGLRLDLDTDTNLPEANTSRLYLEEILQNFITNSIKYTKEGSVTFGAHLEDDHKIRFYVKDTGIGMSKADVQHIFEKFYRSEDYRTRETGGTGLGLYVVKKLADKLNTIVEVDSRLNFGSTFSFILDTTSTIKSDTDDTQAATEPAIITPAPALATQPAPVELQPNLEPVVDTPPVEIVDTKKPEPIPVEQEPVETIAQTEEPDNEPNKDSGAPEDTLDVAAIADSLEANLNALENAGIETHGSEEAADTQPTETKEEIVDATPTKEALAEVAIEEVAAEAQEYTDKDKPKSTHKKTHHKTTHAKRGTDASAIHSSH